MSSKFSVKNFSKDQETLNHAVDALTDYLIVSMFWTLGTSLIFYTNYGMMGLLANIFSNLLIVAWITISYMMAFKEAAKKDNLQVPILFRKRS